MGEISMTFSCFFLYWHGGETLPYSLSWCLFGFSLQNAQALVVILVMTIMKLINNSTREEKVRLLGLSTSRRQSFHTAHALKQVALQAFMFHDNFTVLFSQWVFSQIREGSRYRGHSDKMRHSGWEARQSVERGQFHQHSMSKFYAHRYRKHENSVKLSVSCTF